MQHKLHTQDEALEMEMKLEASPLAETSTGMTNLQNQLPRSPIHLCLANQQRVSPLGRLPQVPVDINGVCSFAYFEVIEIIGDSRPYPALLGIDWAIDNMAIIALKKIQMTFEDKQIRFIAPVTSLTLRPMKRTLPWC